MNLRVVGVYGTCEEARAIAKGTAEIISTAANLLQGGLLAHSTQTLHREPAGCSGNMKRTSAGKSVGEQKCYIYIYFKHKKNEHNR